MEPELPEEIDPVTPDDQEFHGWRLLGFIVLGVLVIAGIAALIDWWVIGPLEGRAY